MPFKNRISQLFNIERPIIQAGMVWNSGWRLASAVSNAGGLGLIGAGSMSPELLEEHILKCQAATDKPFGVNLPLHYSKIEEQIKVILARKVPIVFSSAGNPAIWTRILQTEGVEVAHVVPSAKLAMKAQAAGVDAIVAEGFEAGGHNGKEETTTLCLIPNVRKHIEIPLIAAGGIGSGRAMLAAMILGAEAVQVGSLFACSAESSSHPKFKEAVVAAQEGDTHLVLKKRMPARLLKNDFFKKIVEAENSGADREALEQILGVGKSKRGMFEGDIKDGELEIGQVSSMINSVRSAEEIVNQLWREFLEAQKQPFFYL